MKRLAFELELLVCKLMTMVIQRFLSYRIKMKFFMCVRTDVFLEGIQTVTPYQVGI